MRLFGSVTELTTMWGKAQSTLAAYRIAFFFLITRLPQLASAEYKSGTPVCLQRDSRGPQLSAVPEGAQRSRVRAAVRHRGGLPRGAVPLALARGLRVPDLRRATP